MTPPRVAGSQGPPAPIPTKTRAPLPGQCDHPARPHAAGSKARFEQPYRAAVTAEDAATRCRWGLANSAMCSAAWSRSRTHRAPGPLSVHRCQEGEQHSTLADKGGDPRKLCGLRGVALRSARSQAQRGAGFDDRSGRGRTGAVSDFESASHKLVSGADCRATSHRALPACVHRTAPLWAPAMLQRWAM